MDSQRINLAFVGCGNWARKNHFPALTYLTQHPPALPGVDLNLRGIYSLDLDTARSTAKQFGFGEVYPSVDALMADDEVNAIAVAVPPEAAASVIQSVALRQVPIFSEKPPGINTHEAEALSDLVTVPNVLAFNRRYAPLNNRFRTLVQAMQDVYFVEGHFFRHERLDETFMIGTGIHWINFMEYVFGEIQDVAVDRFPNPRNASWNRVGHLTFPGGLRAILKVFPCSGSQVERLEVHSPTQSIYLTGPMGQAPGSITIDSGSRREIIAPEVDEPLPEIVRVGIVGEYVEFFTAACAGKPTRSNFRNAVNSMRVAEAMEFGAWSRE